jgi:hypothetical protein
MKIILRILIFFVITSLSCNHPERKKSLNDSKYIGNEIFKKGEYGYDLSFLMEYIKPVELVNGNSRLVIAPEYQGRVMTSSSGGLKGFSYGWINYDLISSSEIKEHINPYGGEERIWLGPEGGQFSVFFKKGTPFDLDNWFVPAALDYEPFDVEKQDEQSIILSKKFRLENYSGTTFDAEIVRKISILDPLQVNEQLGIRAESPVRIIGYQSENTLKNSGNNTWNRKEGTLSIWMLSILNPSPGVTVIIPYKGEGNGKIVNEYFGSIPSGRLKVTDKAVFFLADGNFRSKIGIPPGRALPIIGSYDANNRILTLVSYSLPENTVDYVNSLLEIQKEPFKGDVLNSYNDGPAKDGSQLGPFYELEISSPAAFLKPGEEIVHIQRVFHLEGDEKYLDIYAKSLLNVSIGEIRNVFGN